MLFNKLLFSDINTAPDCFYHFTGLIKTLPSVSLVPSTAWSVKSYMK